MDSAPRDGTRILTFNITPTEDEDTGRTENVKAISIAYWCLGGWMEYPARPRWIQGQRHLCWMPLRKSATAAAARATFGLMTILGCHPITKGAGIAVGQGKSLSRAAGFAWTEETTTLADTSLSSNPTIQVTICEHGVDLTARSCRLCGANELIDRLTRERDRWEMLHDVHCDRAGPCNIENDPDLPPLPPAGTLAQGFRAERDELRALVREFIDYAGGMEYDTWRAFAQRAERLLSAERPADETAAEPLIDWKVSYEEALRQRDALTADAERYRFLRDQTFVEAYYIDGAGGVDTKTRCEGAGEHLDLSVDMERIKAPRRDPL